MRKLYAFSAVAFLASLAPALAVDLSNAGLSNIHIGPNGNANIGNSGLSNSASLSGSRIRANTSSTTVFGPGVNQNPAGNGGIGGVGTGFAQTTALEAGGRAVNSTSLSGNGTLTGTVNNRTESGALNPQQGQFNTSTLTGNGTLNGSFERTASSYANTGLNGYSGSQMTGGPGTVSNLVSGSAFGIGASLSGGASLSR